MVVTLQADPGSDGVALAIHGGAGGRPPRLSVAERTEHHAVLHTATRAGERVLLDGGPALDAVCAAVMVLEDSPLFNSAHGAALTAGGVAELDAAVMVGHHDAGAVIGSRTARNPVLAARAVMEQTDHVVLVDPSPARLSEWGVAVVEPSYFITDFRLAQLADLQQVGRTGPRHGTVGAVARDVRGAMAAATSTGGTANQLPGRVGDSPLIGAGTWASDETVAVSCTGVGEEFIRQAVAHSVDARIRHGRASFGEAVDAVLADLVAAGGQGGLIAVDATGSTRLTYNTGGMFCGWIEDGRIRTHVCS